MKSTLRPSIAECLRAVEHTRGLLAVCLSSSDRRVRDFEDLLNPIPIPTNKITSFQIGVFAQ